MLLRKANTTALKPPTLTPIWVGLLMVDEPTLGRQVSRLNFRCYLCIRPRCKMRTIQ